MKTVRRPGLDTRAKKLKYKCKNFIYSSGDRTHNQSILQSHFVPLRHEWPQYLYFSGRQSATLDTLSENKNYDNLTNITFYNTWRFEINLFLVARLPVYNIDRLNMADICRSWNEYWLSLDVITIIALGNELNEIFKTEFK